MSIHAIVTVTHPHIICPSNYLAISSFLWNQVRCTSIGITRVNCLARRNPFESLYRNQGHFGVVSGLRFISPLNVAQKWRCSRRNMIFHFLLLLLDFNYTIQQWSFT